ncbi:MAG: pentapeptide repeat-containing protein [Microcoleus sp.]
MIEKNIQQIINGVEYAATSATGDAVIYIYNYYDANDRTARIKPVDTPFDDIDTPSPYRGLSYFKSDDAQLFFGRDSQIEELEKATEIQNFIPILGASGSGKSSLVFAGLIPKLAEKGNWLFTYFRLGDNPDPFQAIAEALLPLYGSYQGDLAKDIKENKQKIADIFTIIQNKHPDHQLLLFADQFEQLYVSYDEQTQHLFLDLLLKIIQPPGKDSLPRVLVTTMRAEFLGKALSYQPFADAFKNDIKLSPMKPQELAEVIEKPALERKVEFQEGLVKRILDHVSNDKNCLPILEFALDELWKTRTRRLKKATENQEQTDRRLTYDDYQKIGEVKGAIEKYANNFYRDLTPADKEQVPKIFTQLVNFSQFTQDPADRIYVRRVAKKTEFREEGWRLVEVLADKRLVVTNRNADGEDTVEIIHEALIQEWTLLCEWIENDRDFLTWRHQLGSKMAEWNSANEDEGALLRGIPLVIAEDWLQKRQADLTNEREYIVQSFALRDKEIKERKSQQKRNTVIQTTAICLGLLGIILIVLLNRTHIIKAWIICQKKHLAERNLANYYLPGIDLSTANLSKANLSESNLLKANLSGANLQGANLVKTFIQRADFSKADLSKADLSESNLLKANLSGANLQGANLVKTFIQRADFSKADLSKADLLESNLQEANLSGANFQGASLVKTHMLQAHLQETNLSQADLSEANIDGADLSGANFQGAKNLNPDQVKRAKNWEKAKYDAEFSKKLGLKGSK